MKFINVSKAFTLPFFNGEVRLVECESSNLEGDLVMRCYLYSSPNGTKLTHISSSLDEELSDSSFQLSECEDYNETNPRGWQFPTIPMPWHSKMMMPLRELIRECDGAEEENQVLVRLDGSSSFRVIPDKDIKDGFFKPVNAVAL